ncbi:MAG: molybdopterin molybdotransferase MoeA [Candidatus Rokubacteria bacterium]|nr:molybdopterin molybdotransferase MoeA [Candidatus Rokubacteria bacterium]
MLTVEEALEQILSRVKTLPAERVPILSALGRALAEPIVSGREIPPWANSSMDGYAVRAADTHAVPARLTVVGTVTAGAVPSRDVRAGEAVRIFTGAPLPPGADAVVPQEDTDAVDGHVTLRAAVGVGDSVRPRGEDLKAGDVVLEPGAALGPAEIGLLATVGVSQVAVYRRPRVAILSTGNELAELGREPGPGQIPNTNSYSLFAQVREAGGDPLNLGIAADRMESIEERLRWGGMADVLLSSAGVSVGDLDLVRDALTRAGAALHLWQVSMRPGKPITFGSIGERPVFGLPGNPVSAMVTFELFVRPALRRLAGFRAIHRGRLHARALAPIANPGVRRGYLRVTLHRDRAGWGARLTGDQGSAILTSMVRADGLAVVPGDTIVPAGGDVEVIVFRELAQDSV